MQKIFTFLFLSSSLLLGMSACNRDKKEVDETRTFSQFTEVDVNISGDVFIRADSSRGYSARLIGPKWQVDNLKIRQEGTRLIIESNGTTGNVDVNVDLKRVARITCSGSSRVRGGMESISGVGSYGLNSSGPLSIRSSGSGNVIFETNSDNLNVANSGSGTCEVYNSNSRNADLAVNNNGSGRLRVDGKGDVVTSTLTGSGEGDFEGYRAKRAYTTSTGSGSTTIYATELADITISGSGSVYVSGGAQVTSQITGSGRVIMK
jgi:hypothetical protein